MLNSTDKFLVNDGSVTETVTWSEIQSEANPVIVSVVFTPDEPEVNEAVIATPVRKTLCRWRLRHRSTPTTG